MRKDFKFGLTVGVVFSAIFLTVYLISWNNDGPEQDDPARADSDSSESSGESKNGDDSSLVPLRSNERGYVPEGEKDFIDRIERQAEYRRQSPPPVIDDSEAEPPEVADDQTTPQEQTSVRKYTVVSGDTLSGISMKFYNTTSQWQKILEANRDTLKNPAGLKPGMELVIPQ
jgi:LysM repeat protein